MSDKVTIPRPHVPFGPLGVPEMLADVDYLDHAARSIAGGYAVGGYNVTHTVIDLLHSVATALRDAHAAEVRSTDTTGAGVESLPAPCSDECGWCGENMPPTTNEKGE